MSQSQNLVDIKNWTVLFVRTAPIGATYVASQDYYPLELAALGAKVILFAPIAQNERALVKKTDFSEQNIEIVEASTNQWYKQLRTAVQQYAPDIIHVYNNTSKLQFLYRLPLRRQTKFVIDFRSPILSKGLRGLLIKSKTTLDSFAFTSVASHSVAAAHTFIGNTYNEIKWLPPGVEIDKFVYKPNLVSIKESAKVIYIGSLNQRRQLENMIHAIAHAKRHAQFTVDIYGTGDGQDNLQALVEAEQVSDTVHFKGVVDRGTVQTMLHKYDIGLCYTHRSIYDTAPPLKAVEYLACGVPVVATNTQGNATFIQDSVNGLLVGEKPEDFGDGIVKLIQEPHLYHTMVNNSRSSVQEFCWNKLVQDRLVPYYAGLLAAD